MKQYETIKKVRNVIRLNGGATLDQIASVARIDKRAAKTALIVMGDAYIDRWDGSKAVYECIEVPKPCPKP